MHFYKSNLGWTDGLGALIFHGQQTEVVQVYTLTNIFQVAELYETTKFVEKKLMLGYIVGAFSRQLAAFAEGHYILTEKGGQRQLSELSRRNLLPEDVWVLDASDPRRLNASETSATTF